MIKKIRYYIEAVLLKITYFLTGFVSIKTSSSIGSFLTRFVGKILPVNYLARRNLRAAMPELSKEQVKDIIDKMWDNLGRIGGEFMHISRFSCKDVEEYTVVSDKSLKILEAIKEKGKGGILFSGHLGNWEIGPKFFTCHGLPISTVYRPLNNPIVEKVIASARKTKLIPKGSKGAKEIISELQKGHFVIILIDQRMSEGVKVPFFGRDALTPASVATLAIKYKVPLIPSRVVRIEKNKFYIEIEEPIEFKLTGDLQNDTNNIMIKLNQKLEKWIREYPEQWFWVHNRWKM